jgi:hypothetical protein
MKTIAQFEEMTAETRAATLKTTVRAAGNARITVAKILVAALAAGDFTAEKGEMNKYAVEVTGIELRRELQGTYEAVRVLSGIVAGTVPMTEKQFDKILSTAAVRISCIMEKFPEGLSDACEIAISGTDVVKRLSALMKRLKGEPEKSTAGKSTGEGSGESGDVPGIQTPAASPVEAFLAWLGETPLMSVPEIVARLTEDVHGAATPACCERYADFLGRLKAQAETRWEGLEATAAPALIAA